MARLGSKRRPAVVRVKTKKRAAEILNVCNQHGWKVIVGVEPDKPENITDVTTLLNRGTTPMASAPTFAPRIRPNDYCPCGSGKKVKTCCALSASPASSRAERPAPSSEAKSVEPAQQVRETARAESTRTQDSAPAPGSPETAQQPERRSWLKKLFRARRVHPAEPLAGTDVGVPE